MAFIYFQLLQKDSLVKLKSNKKLRIALYLLTITLLGYVTLAPYPAQVDPMKWSNFHNAIFICLSRLLFILALMLLMSLLYTSERALLYRMLSHQMWLPMARLSYAVYLVFPIVSATLLSAMPSSLQLSYYVMFGLLSYCIVSSFAAAFIIFIMLENPIR